MTGLRAILLPLAPTLWAGAGMAETPFLSLQVGADRIEATAADVAGHARDATGRLFIRLTDAFDAQVAALTARPAGAVAELRICGETVLSATLSAPLETARFEVSDPALGERAEARLQAGSCAPP